MADMAAPMCSGRFACTHSIELVVAPAVGIEVGEHVLGEQLVAALGRLGVRPLVGLERIVPNPPFDSSIRCSMSSIASSGVPMTPAPVLLSCSASSAAGPSGKIGSAATSRKYRA